MPFKAGESGNPKGRVKGSRSIQQKSWLRDLMIERIETRDDAIAHFDKLIDDDFAKYLDILQKLFPKEEKVDMNLMGGRTKEEYLYYAQHGRWPDDDSDE